MSVHPVGGSPFRSIRIDPKDRNQLDTSPVSLRRVLGLFHPYRWAMAFVTMLIVVTSVISLAQPFLLRETIDVALPRGDLKILLWCVGGMVAVTVVTQLLGVVQTWRSTLAGQNVMNDLRMQVFDHLQHQSMSFFTRTRGGEIQSRLTNDIAGMQSVVTSTATGIATNLTTALATMIAMFALSWQLSLLSLVLIPLAAVTTRQVALLRRDLLGEQQRTMADLQSQVDESLSVSGALLVKTLGAATLSAQRYGETSSKLRDLELRSQLAGRWRMATMQIAFAIIPAAIYLVAGLPISAGHTSIGTVVAFTSLQANLFRPLLGLFNSGADIVSSMALFSRIFGYLDLPEEVPAPVHPVHLDPATVRGEVRFEQVSVHYLPDQRPALHDVSFVVPAGSQCALVGETGSGKSTLGSLVLRLRDPDQGRVSIDGVDLRELDPEDLSAIVGIVTQETYLIHGSIRDNLLLGAPQASEPELWKALSHAQIAAVIRQLPDGLDTMVGARGYRFSGGEQQRLAVARTLLRNPRVLILDEATSALDNETERELQHALDELAKGRTTITIAHRLSTVAAADQIVVLSAGSVIEQGNHDELMAVDGEFHRLATA